MITSEQARKNYEEARKLHIEDEFYRIGNLIENHSKTPVNFIIVHELYKENIVALKKKGFNVTLLTGSQNSGNNKISW